MDDPIPEIYARRPPPLVAFTSGWNWNVAVAVCVPLVAVTSHVPAAVAVSDVPVTWQLVPVVA